MKTSKIVLSGLLLAFGGGALADEVTCESVDNKRNECRIDTTGPVHMVRQLSKAECVEGKSWGISRDGVWVDKGCRASFAADESTAAGGAPSRVTCESVDNAQKRCAIMQGEVRLVRQLSKSECIEGRSWGAARNGVWVSNGCRAEFESTNPQGYEQGRN